MTGQKHHAEILNAISEQFKGILNFSEAGIYIYINDENFVCNEKFAALLGYKKAGDISQGKDTFLELFVAPKSQKTLVTAYRNAMEKMVGSKVSITWKNKVKGTIATNVILVPIEYQGHLLALHFVEKK